MSVSNLPQKSPKNQSKKYTLPSLSLPPGCFPETSGSCSAVGGQAPISCPPEIVSSGIDTLLLSLQADIPLDLLEKLKEKKLEVQETIDDCLYLPFGVTTLFAFNLQRTGKKLFPYVLKTGDLTVCLSNRKSDSSIPSMQVSVGSIGCNNDLKSLLSSFAMWCKHYKIDIKSEKVSRIDIYADIAVPLVEQGLWNQARMVTRAEKVALYYSNRKMTGLQVGTGDIVLRCYDKIQEMTDKQALHKEEFFQKKWGGVANVTRVEFQLRREAVKSLCPSENNLFAVVQKMPDIWKYLTFDWFRQTAKAVDRLNRNQSRETTSEFWEIVQSVFNAPEKKGCVRDKKQKTINIKSLVDQATGILLTVCAALGHAHHDIFGIIATSADLVSDKMTAIMAEATFQADFHRRVVAAKISF